jgi:hypothetical protein
LQVFIISLPFLFMLLQGCGTTHVHTYLIPAKMEPRWITIEYNNPKCEPLKETASERQLTIPESGFLCTSSPKHTGWHQEKFYLVDGNNRTSIQIEERIFRRESFNIKETSSASNMPACNVMGEEFFYGPKEKLTYENPIKEDKSFLDRHVECGHGIIAKPNP